MSSQNVPRDRPYLVAHIVFRFDYGGLENGLVNVINRLSGKSYRHVVIALTEATGFRERLVEGVEVISLGKQPGKDPAAYWRLYRLLRKMHPDIVHTRNIGTLDCALIAYLAGVPLRIHGEHGWDVADPDGTVRKYRLLRRVLFKFVNRVIAVSRDLERWLTEVVGVPAQKVQQIYNGVDTRRFRPTDETVRDNVEIVVGSVTRFAQIKDPMNLVNAFIEAHRQRKGLRLLMIGDGPLAKTAASALDSAGIDSAASMPGFRDDIAAILRGMDVFVLGSKREGISNTILEAMATGLPVIATETGGNMELVIDQVNGKLVPPEDPAALAEAICSYVDQRTRIAEHGKASRARAVAEFSIRTMTDQYDHLYQELVAEKGL